MSSTLARLALIPLSVAALALPGCAATLQGSSTANADRGQDGWSHIGKTSGGDSVYIDYSTIERDGAYARVWAKTLYAKPQRLSCGDTYWSDRFVQETNCPADQIRFLSSTSFSGSDLDGEVVTRSSTPSVWARVPPGTVGAAIARAACR